MNLKDGSKRLTSYPSNPVQALRNRYLFTSERLGFRNWSSDDLSEFAAMCADPDVMEHFPSTLSIQETKELIERLKDHYLQHGHCYYACEVKETSEFIGFIGLAHQSYEAPFTPAVDMGWRLKKSAWGQGYATEGANRCMQFAFYDLGLDSLVAVCTTNNIKSEKVMQKVGMTRMGEFDHPKLNEHPDYQRCIWYEIKK
ncbi:MAG: GNAT family N-acetyltransferase [Flavobacteriales bacterium]|nr:GNAT family N-acetyltransferase [Flavobacteriales bacterium]